MLVLGVHRKFEAGQALFSRPFLRSARYLDESNLGGLLTALNTLPAARVASGCRSAGLWHFQEQDVIVQIALSRHKQKTCAGNFLTEKEPKYEHREHLSGTIRTSRAPSSLISRMLAFVYNGVDMKTLRVNWFSQHFSHLCKWKCVKLKLHEHFLQWKHSSTQNGYWKRLLVCKTWNFLVSPNFSPVELE
jgi:hypothetical protein